MFSITRETFFLSRQDKEKMISQTGKLERAGDDVKKIFGFLKRNVDDTVLQKWKVNNSLNYPHLSKYSTWKGKELNRLPKNCNLKINTARIANAFFVTVIVFLFVLSLYFWENFEVRHSSVIRVIKLTICHSVFYLSFVFIISVQKRLALDSIYNVWTITCFLWISRWVRRVY